MTQATKDHLTSALITFATAFLLAISPFLDTIDIHNLEVATLLGLVSAGLRAGIKALIQLLASYLAALKVERIADAKIDMKAKEVKRHK